jgi:membrane protease YdiL (CAAX protease family)
VAVTFLVFITLGAISWWFIRHLSYHQDFSLNRFIFMLTISGVDEELVFRGVMPSLLLVRDIRSDYMKANKVLVFLVPTIIFTTMHAWRFADGRFLFDGYTFIVIGFGACAFMYLRLRTRSLVNSLLVHNVLNAGTVLALAAGSSHPGLG